jgi:hypothetical protein
VPNGESTKPTDLTKLSLEVPKALPHSDDSIESLTEKPKRSEKARDEFEIRREEFFGSQ